MKTHLPDQSTEWCGWFGGLRINDATLILWPLDSVQHEAFETMLLLRPTLNNDSVAITVHRHNTRQEELARVRLHLETVCRIRDVLYPKMEGIQNMLKSAWCNNVKFKLLVA